MVSIRRRREEDSGSSSSAVVEIKDLCYNFGNKMAVKDLSFSVSKGSFMGLMGPNGAGKSTTLKCLTGLIRPTSGKVFVHGYDVTVDPRNALAHTGCVIETPAFAKSITAAELLSYTGRIYGLDRYETNLRARDALEILRMWDDRNRNVRGLSKGMRQRVALAQALMSNPDFLILDEPTSGLDPRGMKEMRDILSDLKDGSRTALISTHILPEVQGLCDDITMINHGKVIKSGRVEGLADELFTQYEQVLNVRTLKIIPNEFRMEVREMRGVKDVKYTDDTHMRIVFQGTPEDKADLFDSFFDNYLRIIEITQEGGTLEAIYMQLTDEGEVNIK